MIESTLEGIPSPPAEWALVAASSAPAGSVRMRGLSNCRFFQRMTAYRTGMPTGYTFTPATNRLLIGTVQPKRHHRSCRKHVPIKANDMTNTANIRMPRETGCKETVTRHQMHTATLSTSWPAHQDHESRVELEENVQARFTRYTIVCSEVTLPFHGLVVASKCFEGHSRRRGKHLRSVT